MKITKSLCAAAILASTMLAGLPANAQDAKQTTGKFYLGASAGVIIPSDLHVSATGGATGSGDFSFKAGAGGTLSVGYNVNDYVSAEFQGAYAHYDADKLKGSITIGSTVYSGTASLNGSVDLGLFLANAIVRPLGNQSAFSPYIGGGLGVAPYKLTNNSSGSTYSSADFALDATTGFDYAINNSFTLGLQYQFAWVNTAHNENIGATTIKFGDASAHLLTAKASYRF